jgi:hypothetical protein
VTKKLATFNEQRAKARISRDLRVLDFPMSELGLQIYLVFDANIFELNLCKVSCPFVCHIRQRPWPLKIEPPGHNYVVFWNLSAIQRGWDIGTLKQYLQVDRRLCAIKLLLCDQLSRINSLCQIAPRCHKAFSTLNIPFFVQCKLIQSPKLSAEKQSLFLLLPSLCSLLRLPQLLLQCVNQSIIPLLSFL